MQPPERPVSLTLTSAEALVLFDVLHRWENDGALDSLPYEHDAERVVLWNLSATLEPLIDVVFSRDYRALVDAARRELAPAVDSN